MASTLLAAFYQLMSTLDQEPPPPLEGLDGPGPKYGGNPLPENVDPGICQCCLQDRSL